MYHNPSGGEPLYSKMCYQYHYNRSRTFRLIICLLLLFILLSAIIQPKEADAFVWALPALAGGEALVDLVLGGLFAGGVIAADTYIKNSDLYKTVTAFLGSLTAEELAKVEEIGSAGQAAYSTAAISGLLSKALTACDGLTVYKGSSYNTANLKDRFPISALAVYGFTASQVKEFAEYYSSQDYVFFFLHCGNLTFLYRGRSNGREMQFSTGVSKWDTSVSPPQVVEYVNTIDYFGYNPNIYDFNNHSLKALEDSSYFEAFLSSGWKRYYGSVNSFIQKISPQEFTFTYRQVFDDLSVAPDVINVPEVGLSICPDVTLAPDTAIAEDWATDYAMSGSIATSPSVTLNPELAGDVVITPGDIGGGGDVVNPDVPTDGTIAGLLSALLDWLKGILQSILDAIRAIPAAITGLLQSILDTISAIPAAIASIFDVSQFSLDFSGFKNLVIKDKFPFCIPWDFYRAIKVFAQSATDYVDIETAYFEIHQTVDLSPFVVPIAFFRYVATVWFALVLIFRTRDLMKW